MSDKIPQSQRKAIEYFYEVSNKKDFIETISDIRTKYLPVDLQFNEETEDVVESFKFLPLEEEASIFLGEDQVKEIEKEIEDRILKKYGLNNKFAHAIWYYIFHDFDPDVYLDEGVNAGLCKVEDLNEKKKYEPSEVDIENELATYPLAIKISPYASKRDILDFVSKVFKEKIYPIQTKYKSDKIKLGKTKAKNQKVASRNRLIWTLQKMPRKDIAKIVKEKTGEILDVGMVGKIISLENQKRKEV